MKAAPGWEREEQTRLPAPASPAIFQAREGSPAPQAMISLAASALASPCRTSFTALTWWSRSDFLGLRRAAAFWLVAPTSRSVLEIEIASILLIGGLVYPLRRVLRSVALTITRWVNGFARW